LFNDCGAEGVLTEGSYDFRVSQVTIEDNFINVQPHIFAVEDDEDVVYHCKKWPMIWISDTDDVIVRNNYGRCQYNPFYDGINYLVGGSGLYVDGCNLAVIEDNHFDGMSRALSIQVDNRNKNNSTRHSQTVVRNNRFTRIQRADSDNIFLGSLQKDALIDVGYKHRFDQAPIGSPDPVFSENLVEGNIFQLVVQPEDVPFDVSFPALFLNHPIVWWPDEMNGDGFFEGHSCENWPDEPTDNSGNEITGNFINLIPYLSDPDLRFSKIHRIHQELNQNQVCEVDDQQDESRTYRHDTEGDIQFPVSEILDENDWDAEFFVDDLYIAELDTWFMYPRPALKVESMFNTLEDAIAYDAETPSVQWAIVVEATVLTGAGNTNLSIPSDMDLLITANTTCTLDGENQVPWFNVGPRSTVEWRNFTFVNADASNPAIECREGTLKLTDCEIVGPASFVFITTEVELAGAST